MDTMTYNEEFEIIDTLDVIEHLDGTHWSHIQLCSDGVVREQILAHGPYTPADAAIDRGEFPF